MIKPKICVFILFYFMTMEIQAQERLNTLFGLYFSLIDKTAYHLYRQEVEQSQDSMMKLKRYTNMVHVLKKAIEKVEVDELMDKHFEDLYFQIKKRDLLVIFENKEKIISYVKASLTGIVNLTNFCSSENWLNHSDRRQVKSCTYYLESTFLTYQANQITKEFWFYEAYYNFSHEFLDTLKAQLPPMEAVLMMESKYLLPMYLGDDHLTKKESLSMEEYEADENSMVKFWRMSDELVNYLYRKLTENPEPYQGLINEDYQLFVEMLRKAKEEDCYFVLDFL